MEEKVEFRDLKKQYEVHKQEMDMAIAGVLKKVILLWEVPLRALKQDLQNM